MRKCPKIGRLEERHHSLGKAVKIGRISAGYRKRSVWNIYFNKSGDPAVARHGSRHFITRLSGDLRRLQGEVLRFRGGRGWAEEGVEEGNCTVETGVCLSRDILALLRLPTLIIRRKGETAHFAPARVDRTSEIFRVARWADRGIAPHLRSRLKSATDIFDFLFPFLPPTPASPPPPTVFLTAHLWRVRSNVNNE